MTAPLRRRWFQFSLAEYLVLTTLLCIVWWQASTRPFTQYNQNWVTKDSNGVVISSSHADSITLFRPPFDVAIKRGATWSAATMGICVAGSIAIRGGRVLIQRRKERPTQS
jgi:hypothetical protein